MEWSRRGLNPRLSYGTSFVKFLWINVIHRFSTMSIFGCLFAPAYVRSIKMETQGRSNIMIRSATEMDVGIEQVEPKQVTPHAHG